MKQLLEQSDIRRSKGSRGFSLVEVMIAMGIFAVGFVAVAAMFPAGVILQRETISDVESQLVARNAAAMVRARKLTYRQDGIGVDLGQNSGSGELQTFASINASLGNRWQLNDRSYPMVQGPVDERKYYWVPMIRRTKTPAAASDWIVVVFVVRRESNLNYTTNPGFAGPIYANPSDPNGIPRVVGVTATASGNFFDMGANKNDLFPAGGDGIPDQVRPGDFVADNNGTVYNVTDATSNGFFVYGGIPPTSAGTIRVWYAPHPTGGSSPCTRILLLSGVIEEVP